MNKITEQERIAIFERACDENDMPLFETMQGDEIIKLKKRIAELEANKAKSNEFINWFLDAVFKGSDICGDGAQDKMFELGILTREIYNPEIHTLRDGSECDKGDYIYFRAKD